MHGLGLSMGGQGFGYAEFTALGGQSPEEAVRINGAGRASKDGPSWDGGGGERKTRATSGHARIDFLVRKTSSRTAKPAVYASEESTMLLRNALLLSTALAISARVSQAQMTVVNGASFDAAGPLAGARLICNNGRPRPVRSDRHSELDRARPACDYLGRVLDHGERNAGHDALRLAGSNQLHRAPQPGTGRCKCC